MSTAALQRETFVTSRLLDYFTPSELAMQIGHRSALWPLALGKELFPLDEACLLGSVFLFQGRNTV